VTEASCIKDEDITRSGKASVALQKSNDITIQGIKSLDTIQ